MDYQALGGKTSYNALGSRSVIPNLSSVCTAATDSAACAAWMQANGEYVGLSLQRGLQGNVGIGEILLSDFGQAGFRSDVGTDQLAGLAGRA